MRAALASTRSASSRLCRTWAWRPSASSRSRAAPGQVAPGGRGPAQPVQGQGLDLEVLVLACLVEHGAEVPGGRPGVRPDRQGGEEAAGEQGAVATSGRPVPPVVLLEQGARRGLIAQVAQPAGQVGPSGRGDAEVAAGGCGPDGPGQGVKGLLGVARPLLDAAEGRQVQGRLADEPQRL